MKKSMIIMISGILLASCEQISKSIKDTLKPTAIDSIAYLKKEEVVPKSPFDPAVERQIDEAQRLVNTIMEKNRATHVQHPKEGKNTNFLTNETELHKAEEALKELPQYMGKQIFIYSLINFYADGRIHVMLQHPQNPEYVDNYDYADNHWSEARPEQLSVRDDIKKRLVPLDNIHFSNIARAAAIYDEKVSQIEGAAPVTNIYISVWKNTLRWYPGSINGSRERYSIELHENGTLKKFERE